MNLKSFVKDPADPAKKTHIVRYDGLNNVVEQALGGEVTNPKNADRYAAWLRAVESPSFKSRQWLNGYDLDRIKETLVSPPDCMAEVDRLRREIDAVRPMTIFRSRCPVLATERGPKT